MINVCHNCGQYRADKIIDPKGPFAICPVCQHPHSFRQLPLFVVCGPSGAGKSTVCERLVITVTEVVILDADILWRPEFNKPDDHYRDFFETWLRLGKSIGQSGRPLALFNAGAIPDNIEPCIERRYFGEIHYLALVCDDEVLVERLKQRPGWVVVFAVITNRQLNRTATVIGVTSPAQSAQYVPLLQAIIRTVEVQESAQADQFIDPVTGAAVPVPIFLGEKLRGEVTAVGPTQYAFSGAPDLLYDIIVTPWTTTWM
jgi:hypothetical protein